MCWVISVILKNLVCKTQPLVGRSRLLNLHYLVDLTAYRLTGEPATPATYTPTKNGVFSKEVLETLYNLISQKEIIEITLPTTHVYYTKHKPDNSDVHDALLQFIELTIQQYAQLPDDQLSKIVKILFKNQKTSFSNT